MTSKFLALALGISLACSAALSAEAPNHAWFRAASDARRIEVIRALAGFAAQWEKIHPGFYAKVSIPEWISAKLEPSSAFATEAPGCGGDVLVCAGDVQCRPKGAKCDLQLGSSGKIQCGQLMGNITATPSGGIRNATQACFDACTVTAGCWASAAAYYVAHPSEYDSLVTYYSAACAPGGRQATSQETSTCALANQALAKAQQGMTDARSKADSEAARKRAAALPSLPYSKCQYFKQGISGIWMTRDDCGKPKAFCQAVAVCTTADGRTDYPPILCAAEGPISNPSCPADANKCVQDTSVMSKTRFLKANPDLAAQGAGSNSNPTSGAGK